MEKMYYFHWALMPLTSASKCYSSPHSATILEQVQGTFWKKWVPGIASHNKASLSPKNCSSWMSTKEKHHSPPAVLASSSISSADFGVTPPTSQMAEGMFFTPFSQASFPVVLFFFLIYSHLTVASFYAHDNFYIQRKTPKRISERMKVLMSISAMNQRGLGNPNPTLCVSAAGSSKAANITQDIYSCEFGFHPHGTGLPIPTASNSSPESTDENAVRKSLGLISPASSHLNHWAELQKTSVNSHAIAITK